MNIQDLLKPEPRPQIPPLNPGMTVRASSKVVEGERERLQVFEGVIIRVRAGGINSSVTIRRIARGVGVERTFFLNSPRLEKVEVVSSGKVRRAKLYYLRQLQGKKARLREKVRPETESKPEQPNKEVR